MQTIAIFMAIFLHGSMAKDTVPERIADSASIVLRGMPADIFPLFGAYEEKRWTAHWNPEPLYPAEEKIETGTVFSTPGHSADDGPYIWYVTCYQPADLKIQYLVNAPGRCWTITVQCHPLEGNRSRADISYVFTGWTTASIQRNKHHLQLIYAHGLKDWENDINTYLKK